MTNSEAYTILDGLRSELAAALLGLNEDPRLKEVTEAQIEALGCACEALSVPEVAIPSVLECVEPLNLNGNAVTAVPSNMQYIETGVVPANHIGTVDVNRGVMWDTFAHYARGNIQF